jgi:hypothetical protein
MASRGARERRPPGGWSAAGSEAVGEPAKAQAARGHLGHAIVLAVSGCLVAGITAAGELVPHSGADWIEAAERQQCVGQAALLLRLVGRQREIVRVERAFGHASRARRARVRRRAAEAGKGEERIRLDSHVNFLIVRCWSARR